LQVVGILALFFMPVPLFLKQCYTVWVGICVAYIFTHVPEWTSWMLLVIMALYDLAAVLLPGGPLKVRAGGGILLRAGGAAGVGEGDDMVWGTRVMKLVCRGGGGTGALGA
jgi:hypothetical protein